MLAAGARKELTCLTEYGQPLQPFQRIRREYVEYQTQHPANHMKNLEKYLQVIQYLLPHEDNSLLRPTLRHPDLQPNNVFVSDTLEITGVIDWQHCAILPLFLQAGIPGSLQNYGDSVSETLEPPMLPDDFDDQSENEQMNHVLQLRKRQLHYHYAMETRKLNAPHARALEDDTSVLRRKLFRRSGEPWEGCNTIFKRDLIELTQWWRRLHAQSKESTVPECPISFSKEEAADTVRLADQMEAADTQYQTCLDLVGCGPEGWVPNEQYDDVRQREQQLKTDTLEVAESEEERKEIIDNWIFDDFDETPYM